MRAGTSPFAAFAVLSAVSRFADKAVVLSVGLSLCQCHCLILKSDPNIPTAEDMEMEKDYGLLLQFKPTVG